jgi:hypothetical protein
LFVTSAAPSRLANVSVVASGSEALAVGFALGGGDSSETTDLLARAAGPSLAQFGIAGALRDPVLRVYRQQRLVSENDDWGDEASLAATAAAVGAFPFAAASKDSAVVLSIAPGSYTAEVVDANREPGLVVMELYDATLAGNRKIPRLVNVSARGITADEAAPLTAGFTIQGEATITVLLRGVGPSLTGLGVEGALEDPRLTLFRGTTAISSNDNWGDGDRAAIVEAAKRVGAFALAAEGRDAAMLVRLKPGSYSAQIAGLSGAGVALVEIYEVP